MNKLVLSFLLAFVVLSGVVALITKEARHIQPPANEVAFTNVRVLNVGTKFVSFVRSGEVNGDRVRVWNIKSFHERLDDSKTKRSELDITMEPKGVGWEIKRIENATPLPPLPK